MGEQQDEEENIVEGPPKKGKKKKVKKNGKSAKKPSDIVSCIAFLSRDKKKPAGRQIDQLTEEDASSESDHCEKRKRKKQRDEADSYDALQNVFNDERENEKIIKEDNLIEEEKKYLFEDELSIEDADALTLNGKIYSDIDDYPLCLEVIGGESYYRGKNIVAVGTMKKEIGLWDINKIDTLEALSYLGGKDSATRGEKRKKRRKKDKAAGETANSKGETPQGTCEEAIVGQKRKQSKDNLQGHTECVTCLNSSKLIPNLMCSGSKDCSIKLWDLSNLTYLHTFNFHKKKINNVSFHAKESSILLSTSSDKTLKIYDIRKDTVGLNIPLDSTPESTTWNKFNEKEIFLSDVDGYVNKIDIRYVTDPSSSFSHNNTVRFKAFSNSCISLVSTHYPNLTLAGSEDGMVKAYDFGTFGEEGPTCVYTKNLKRNLYCMKDNEDWPNVIFFGCEKLYDWDLKSCTELREYFNL